MSNDLKPVPPPLGPRPTPYTFVSIISLLTALGLGGLNLVAPGKTGDVPSIFGTVSSWISAGGIMGILALLVWGFLGNRTIGVQARLAENADEADLREHWAREVEMLREAVRDVEAHYRSLLADSDLKHEQCQRDRDSLRDEVRKLKDEVAGLRRQVVTQSTDRVLALGDPKALPPSEAVRSAARRVREHTRGDRHSKS